MGDNRSRLLAAGVVLLVLLNTALFTDPKSDLHDAAVIAGSLLAGLLVQGVLVAIVYGLYRLVRRGRPRQQFLVIALRALSMLTFIKILTLLLPASRLAKVR